MHFCNNVGFTASTGEAELSHFAGPDAACIPPPTASAPTTAAFFKKLKSQALPLLLSKEVSANGEAPNFLHIGVTTHQG
jgi:hypothetical protein